MPIEKIEYEQWRKVITRAQIGMAICVFFAEAVINTFLYITRSQGYNPDTIVNKLIRYQLITTLCNILPVSLSWILCKFTQSNQC